MLTIGDRSSHSWWRASVLSKVDVWERHGEMARHPTGIHRAAQVRDEAITDLS